MLRSTFFATRRGSTKKRNPRCASTGFRLEEPQPNTEREDQMNQGIDIQFKKNGKVPGSHVPSKCFGPSSLTCDCLTHQ